MASQRENVIEELLKLTKIELIHFILDRRLPEKCKESIDLMDYLRVEESRITCSRCSNSEVTPVTFYSSEEAESNELPDDTKEVDRRICEAWVVAPECTFADDSPESTRQSDNVSGVPTDIVQVEVKQELPDEDSLNYKQEDEHLPVLPLNSQLENIFKWKSNSLPKKAVNKPLEVKYYSCNLCDFTTRLNASLDIHKEKHKPKILFHPDEGKETHGFEILSCHMCAFKCSMRYELVSHTQTHFESYVCSLRGSKYLTQTGLEVNLSKTKDKRHVCELCNYNSASKHSFKIHMEKHGLSADFTMPAKEKPFTCDLCDYKTRLKGSLQLHKQTHFGTKRLMCATCGYRCSTKLCLKNHMESHSQTVELCCNVCSYTTFQRSHLKRHLEVHAMERTFQCETCGHTCKDNKALAVHMRSHTGEKPFQCDICGYKSTVQGSLQAHIKRVHFEEKSFECKLCDYKSFTRFRLKEHQRTHTGEKPFNCTVCDYKGSDMNTLKKHLRTHTGEKPFACNLCSYKTSQKPNLKIHARVHTGEKPYSCAACDYKCKYQGDLKKHSLTHATVDSVV